MDSGMARWRRMEDLFARVRPLTTRSRGRILEATCRGDEGLRHEVLALVAADDDAHALAIERLAEPDETSAPECTPHRRFGPWRTLDVIGAGGMGTVCLGERADGQYEQRVAIKVADTPPACTDNDATFDLEHRILARLAHPNIAHLLDAGRTPDGTRYMVMDLVDGEPITTFCDRHRLDIRRRLELFLHVCEATQHAHQALVVHGDLKPSNILVTSDGLVRLVDFGIARLLEPGPAGVPASAQPTGATLRHAPPEQLRGEAITTSADIYALGVVLFELLTGVRPYDDDPEAVERLCQGDNPQTPAPPSVTLDTLWRLAPEQAKAVTAVRASSPRRLSQTLRGDLDAIVVRALHADPAARYASSAELAADVRRFRDGYPVTARALAWSGRLRRFIRRHRLAVSAGAAVGVLVLSLGALAVLHLRSGASERERIARERDRAEEMTHLLIDLFETANPDVVPGGDRQTVAEFLARAETRVLRQLDRHPDVAARLQHVLGLVHRARSADQRARELLTSSLALHRRHEGPDAPATLATQVHLAEQLAWLADRSGAGALIDDADERIRRSLGADHPLLAAALHVRAGLSASSLEALQYLEPAVAIARRTLTREDSKRIRYVTSLAVALVRTERHEEARQLFDEAQRDAEAINGGRSPVLIGVMNDRTALDHALGDLAAAETRHRRALALANDVVGPDSFEVANALNNLAVALASQGRHEDAAAAFRESHTRHIRLFGLEHPRTTNALRNVGMALFLRDSARQCIVVMRQAANTRGRTFGRADVSATYMRAQLARCLLRDGRIDEGVALLVEALPILREAGSDAADYLANVRLWLGVASLEAGDVERAAALVQAAVEQHRTHKLPSHPTRIEAECELAHVRRAQGAHAEARMLAASCASRLGRAGSMPAWRVTAARQLLRVPAAQHRIGSR